ncbi:MAG: energy transducer TonB [Bacteroidetes bacterium]|nr:energy transducer TonB [Bacteroidota bacterium]MBS1629655.1 energy transducer TonB [Bacteroidota bacterium]
MNNWLLIPACLLTWSAAAQPAAKLLSRQSMTLTDGCYLPRYEGEDSVATEFTFLNADSSVRKELRELKTNRLMRREIFKGQTPVGIWMLQYNAKAPAIEWAYDIAPKGILSSCDNGYLYQMGDPDLSFGGQGHSFSPPELADGQSVEEFIRTHLQSPACSQERQLGELRLKGILTENGSLEELAITKSLTPALDAEVIRAVKQLHFTKPALLDGKSVRLCVRLPVSFSEQ